MQQRVQRELADVVARPLSTLSLKSHGDGQLTTEQLKKANRTPIFKEGRREDLRSYKQVSLTLIQSEHKKILFLL